MATYSIEFKAMGSHMQVWLSVHSASAAQILMHVPGWFEEWEAALSRFRPTSELSLLNAQAGQWVNVSPILYDVITEARDVAEITNGVFNPMILNALEAVGYDKNFEPQMQLSPLPCLPEPMVVPGWESLRLDDERRAVYVPYRSRIDLGGIGKGWAAQQAADRLSDYGACLVNAGGDLAAHGSPDESEGWAVVIPNMDESETLFKPTLVEQAAATSGTDYRHWEHDGKSLHHLIDPRTGYPSESAVVRSTVIAPDAIEAVIWAKVSLMTETFPEYPTVFFYQDGTVRTNMEIES